MMVLGILALPLTVIWMSLTVQWTIEGFILGFGLSYGVLWIGIDRHEVQRVLRVRKLPRQTFWLVVYIIRVAYDTVISSLGVTRRILSRDMGISPGILAVSTQDPTRNPVITALCTHAITITPGEMVIDIIPGKNEEIMCVHCLNAEESARVVQAQQKQRLELVKKVVGDE